MTFKLSTNIQAGQKIKTRNGWRKVKEVTQEGAVVKEGVILFGETVFGWKSSPTTPNKPKKTQTEGYFDLIKKMGSDPRLNQKPSETRERLLGQALLGVLVKVGVLREDAQPSGPELINAANDFINPINPR